MSLAEFAVQFTEKVPLFDFFDAGRGKERADDSEYPINCSSYYYSVEKSTC